MSNEAASTILFLLIGLKAFVLFGMAFARAGQPARRHRRR